MKRIILIFITVLWACTVMASPADDMSKNVTQQIRMAEKQFFAGKFDQAAKLLNEAGAGLDQLQKEDASHKSLKSLTSKYDRLKKQVDKKLGAGQSTESQASSFVKTGGPHDSGSQSLSHGAKGNLEKAHRQMDFAEKELAKAEQNLQGKEYNMVDSRIFNTTSNLDTVGDLLAKVVKNNKADPSHPEVAAANARFEKISHQLDAFTQKAKTQQTDEHSAAADAARGAKAINDKWLPLLSKFTTRNAATYPQYLGSHDKSMMDKQEDLYRQARKVLGDVEREVPAGKQPDELKKAVKDLRFALEVYDDAKIADSQNRLIPLESTLSDWEKRFAENKNWREGSERALFIITPQKLAYQKSQIADLHKTDPVNGEKFAKRLAVLEKENASWTGKKQQWMERPRPFPEAKMKNKGLEKEMEGLLENRGIKAQNLVITDRDWWVQAGEFRYVSTAVLSKDEKGNYWSKVSFRQIQTLAGYGPTEIWDVDEIRIRLP
ncbi:hypothetical protein [uncultured Desulfobacter sp.]|uniref:hypothetical protein n=1 Tax=uncultured Desulfobacter sp. TaxID=240139 RepID=UPI002AAC108D|nr:hypothetical protein [uncultured Desulfobacter sp.]